MCTNNVQNEINLYVDSQNQQMLSECNFNPQMRMRMFALELKGHCGVAPANSCCERNGDTQRGHN